MPFLCCAAAEVKNSPEGSKEIPKPANGRPWKHDESGIQFPQKLGSLTMEGGHRYEDPALGVTVRYLNEDGRVRAAIYVYPCKQPHGSEEEKLKVTSDEAGAALGEIKGMETQGTYSKVEIGEGASWKVPTAPNENEKTVFVEVPLSYELHETKGETKISTPVRSRMGVTVVGNYIVKVRYTYPADLKEEGEAESVKWVKKVRMALSEPYLRTVAEEALKKYRQDPLSEEGAAAAGGVVLYADQSPFVSLTIPAEILQWSEACNQVAPDDRMPLLQAYIAGGTEASLKDQYGDEVVEAAMASTADFYKRLKKKHAALKVEDLEKLVEAVEAKKGVDFFRKLDSIAKLKQVN
ncbi:hypothetical protein G5S37_31775 [Roseimicrobium sp. ORNL1]|nr:hypothetical protein G5S37_31775 [Roseimicrobium sp. ORNL1]